jgi:hypothetical protein
MPQESPTDDYAALFDEGEQDDYAALFDDAEPVEPMAPTDEGGGGDQGPPTQFPDEPIDPVLRQPAAVRREAAKQEGWEDAIPFLRDLEAAGVMAFTDQSFDQAKAASTGRRDALREEFPTEYYTRNVPGSIGVGVLANRAGGPKAMGVGPVDALAMYGQGSNQGSPSFNRDVVEPMLIGGAVAPLVRPGMKLAGALGKLLQVPLAAAEKLIEQFGPRRVMDMIRGVDTSEAGALIAKRAEALKQNIDAADAFVPAKSPKIRPETPEDWRALELADEAERGKAEILSGDGNYRAPSSLEGGEYDDALRAAMRKNVPDFDPSSDLLGEFERLKYPDLKPPPPDLSAAMPESMAAAPVDKPTKVARVPAEAPSHLQPADGHGLDPVIPPAPKAPRLPPRAKIYRMLKDEIGLDDHDLSKADGYYEAWKAGMGPKPPPFQGAHLDEANQVFGRTGRRRFTSAREVFDHVLAANEGKSWEDVERTLPLMRTIPGFEKLRLPAVAEELILSSRQLAPAERSASFNPARLDAQIAADKAAAAERAMGERVAAERADPDIAHKGEFRGPTGRAKDKPKLVRVPAEGEGSFADDFGLKPADPDSLVSGVHQRRVRLDDSALEPGVREESELSRQYRERLDRSASVQPGIEAGPTSAQRAEMLSAVKADTKAGVQQRRAELVAKAREYRALMAQADAIEGANRMEAARLRGIADKSRAEVAALTQNAGPRAGDFAADAGARGSVMVAGGAVPLPMKLLRRMAGGAVGDEVRDKLSLAMAASDAGQRLSSWAAANAESWAAAGGELGRLAQWALSGSGGLRMFMLGQAAQELGESDGDVEGSAGVVVP